MDLASQDVLVSVVFGLSVLFLILVVFSFVRISGFTRRFYCTRRFSHEVAVKPKRLTPALLGWVWPVWTYPEADIISTAGLDAAVYLRVLSLGCRAFFWISLWSCAFILPINYAAYDVAFAGLSQNGTAVNEAEVWDAITAAQNVLKGKWSWVQPLSAYLLTTFMFQLLWSYNRDISDLRVKYLATQGGTITHTVLLTDIPGFYDGTVYDVAEQALNRTLLGILPRTTRDGVIAFLHKTFNKASSAVKAATDVVDDLAVGRLDIAKIKGQKPETLLTSSGSVPGTQAAHAPSSSSVAGLSTSHVLPAGGHAGAVAEIGDAGLDVWNRAQRKLSQGVSMQDMVRQELELVYGKGSVVSVNVVNNQDQLSGPVRRYKEARRALEDVLDHYAGEMRRRKHTVQRIMVRVSPQKFGDWAVSAYGRKTLKLDALLWYPTLLLQLQDLIEERTLEAKHKYLPSAFVTFRQRTDATIASTALHSQDESYWRMQVCPYPQEVVWNNLRMRSWERVLWRTLGWTLVLLLTLAYVPVVIVVQSYLSLPLRVSGEPGDPLDAYPAWRDFILNQPFAAAIVRAVVPVLLYRALLMPVAPLIALVCRLAGLVSEGAIDRGVMVLFHSFQWLITLLANSILTLLALQKFLATGSTDNSSIVPDDIDQTLSNMMTRLVTGVKFFTCYVLTSGLVYRPVVFLRLHKLVEYMIRYPLAATQRARDRLNARQYSGLGASLSEHTVILAIGLGYSTLNPVVPVAGLVYFIVNTVLERYNVLYVTSRKYESAGQIWALACDQIVYAIYTFQLLVFLALLVARSWMLLLMVPLFLLSLLVHAAMYATFRRPWTVLALMAAAEFDQREQQGLATVQQERQQQERRLAQLAQLQAGNAEAARDSVRSDAAGVHADEALQLRAAEKARRRVEALYVSPYFRIRRKQLNRLLLETARCRERLEELGGTDRQAVADEEAGQHAPAARATSSLRTDHSVWGGSARLTDFDDDDDDDDDEDGGDDDEDDDEDDDTNVDDRGGGAGRSQRGKDGMRRNSEGSIVERFHSCSDADELTLAAD